MEIDELSKCVIVEDSKEIDDKMVEEFSIANYCIKSNGSWKIDFVGFIYTKNSLIISFPKHYLDSNYKIDSLDITLLVEVISSYFKSLGAYEPIDNINNFPYQAYQNICKYYYKYGIYSETKNMIKKSFEGHINWRKTITSSQKIINNGNLIFLPFYINKSNEINVFITDCMTHVLSDGYEKFGRIFQKGVKFNNYNYLSNFNNYAFVIDKLNYIKHQYFKDTTLRLVNDLIDYYKWKAKNADDSIFIVKSFSHVWENMVQKYLNKNFYCMDETNDNMIFKNNCKCYNFIKSQEFIERFDESFGEFSNSIVEYDHITEDGLDCIVMDSKYYNSIKELNYKQVSYYYFLKNGLYKNRDTIINGLILPTSKRYYSKVHINRKNIDGLYIREHYLNIKEVMISFIDRY